MFLTADIKRIMGTKSPDLRSSDFFFHGGVKEMLLHSNHRHTLEDATDQNSECSKHQTLSGMICNMICYIYLCDEHKGHHFV
jgi:hypothetical protein